MRKHILLPALAVAGGCAGFVLRTWQLALAYDPNTRLFQMGSPYTLALLGMMLALAALFLVLVRGGSTPEDYLPAYRCPSTLYMTVMTASAFLFFGTGALGLLDNLGRLTFFLWGQVQTTSVAAACLCAVLCFPAGLAILLMGRAGYRGEITGTVSMLASFPPFCALVWMFSTYLENGSNPILMEYVFTLLAAALLLLSHYYAAAYFFGSHRPRRALFFSLMGIVVGLTSLADGPDRFAALITLALLLSALAQTYALLRSCFGPDWPDYLLERMPRGADEDEDENDAP